MVVPSFRRNTIPRRKCNNKELSANTPANERQYEGEELRVGDVRSPTRLAESQELAAAKHRPATTRFKAIHPSNHPCQTTMTLSPIPRTALLDDDTVVKVIQMVLSGEEASLFALSQPPTFLFMIPVVGAGEILGRPSGSDSCM